MVNRGAIILRCKPAMVKWINETDPDEEASDVTLEDVNKERTVYLVSDHDAENIDRWIKLNFKALFEAELEGWYLDEDMWPKKRTLKVFHEWFDVECHSVIEDTVGTPIEDDEI